MTFVAKLSPDLREQARAALPEIEAAQGRFKASSPPEQEGQAARELLPLLQRHGGLLHTLIHAELAAVLETGEAALAPLVASPVKRSQMVHELDGCLRFTPYRESLNINPVSAPSLLSLAVELFRAAAAEPAAIGSHVQP